jgi:predicted nucleotidyltransferase
VLSVSLWLTEFMSIWPNIPSEVHDQLDDFISELQAILGLNGDSQSTNLLGVYLHGSLAMGGFNAAHSDIDLLIVDRVRLPLDIKLDLARLLLQRSNQPAPIEIHFLAYQDLHPWRYPPLFDLHYSEAWRSRFEVWIETAPDSSAGPAIDPFAQPTEDPDLGAHIAVARARGIALFGPPPTDIFPPVPPAAYLSAVLYDLQDAFQDIQHNTVTHVLNLCRTQAYLHTGKIYSKEEGGEWGLRHLPARHHRCISAALANYLGENQPQEFSNQELDGFARYSKKTLLSK